MNLREDDLVSAVALVVDTDDNGSSNGDYSAAADGPAADGSAPS